jgi:chemotaxis protein methyltransferase CheR
MNPSPPALSRLSLNVVRDLVYKNAGIDLSESGKETLIESRLALKLRETGCRSYEEYLVKVQRDSTGESLIALIDALTTNFTSFYREPQHFEFLRDTILPLVKQRKRIQIWCAASSTGEEPYTFAFALLDALGPAAYHTCRILATDISTRALALASDGVYSSNQMEALPRDWPLKYTLRDSSSAGAHGRLRIKPEVRNMVDFQRLNLIEPFTHEHSFCLISCRNVLIYFDTKTQEKVVRRMASFLEPGGHLFVGHAEGLVGVNHGLHAVRSATYRKSAT